MQNYHKNYPKKRGNGNYHCCRGNYQRVIPIYGAGLASCYPNYKSQEWYHLIPQAVITLNLLRSSRTNPSLSAHASINRNFDFNATPLAPTGTKILVHESSSTRPSFSTHSVYGWYIGLSLHHYRCYHCYIPSTESTRNAEMVEFFPKHFDSPRITNSAYLLEEAEDIISILSSKKAIFYHPSLSFGPHILTAYFHVASILQRAVQTTPIPTQIL